MESRNVNFYEYIEVYEAKPQKELEKYKSFVYSYEGMPTKEDATYQATNKQKVYITIKSQTINS